MSTSKLVAGLTYAGEANADLSSSLHLFAKAVTGSKVDLQTSAGGVVIGTIVEAAAAGYTVTVQTGGIGKVIAGGSISAGDRIAADTAGKAVAASVGDFEVGTALNDYSAGELVSFIFASGRRHA